MRSPNNNGGRRSRNRQGRRPQQTNRNTVYESNGPEAKVRGTAAQVYEKYTTLARDASSAGDHVRAEGLLQHAEHYLRIVNSQKPTEKPGEKPAEGQSQAQPQGQAQADGQEGGEANARENRDGRDNRDSRDNRDNRERNNNRDRDRNQNRDRNNRGRDRDRDRNRDQNNGDQPMVVDASEQPQPEPEAQPIAAPVEATVVEIASEQPQIDLVNDQSAPAAEAVAQAPNEAAVEKPKKRGRPRKKDVEAAKAEAEAEAKVAMSEQPAIEVIHEGDVPAATETVTETETETVAETKTEAA